MNNTNQAHDNPNAENQLSEEQLDQISGGITPIPIPGTLALKTNLQINVSRINLANAIREIDPCY